MDTGKVGIIDHSRDSSWVFKKIMFNYYITILILTRFAWKWKIQVILECLMFLIWCTYLHNFAKVRGRSNSTNCSDSMWIKVKEVFLPNSLHFNAILSWWLFQLGAMLEPFYRCGLGVGKGRAAFQLNSFPHKHFFSGVMRVWNKWTKEKLDNKTLKRSEIVKHVR